MDKKNLALFTIVLAVILVGWIYWMGGLNGYSVLFLLLLSGYL